VLGCPLGSGDGNVLGCSEGKVDPVGASVGIFVGELDGIDVGAVGKSEGLKLGSTDGIDDIEGFDDGESLDG